MNANVPQREPDAAKFAGRLSTVASELLDVTALLHTKLDRFCMASPYAQDGDKQAVQSYNSAFFQEQDVQLQYLENAVTGLRRLLDDLEL